MADNRTEKPTPKRRKEARDKGQIARSTDLTSAAVLLGGILAIVVTAPTMLDHFSQIVRVGLSQSGDTHLAGRAGVGDLFSWGVQSMLAIVAPVAVTAAAAGLIANVVQNRPAITTSALGPQWNRLDPRAGFKRLFGVRALFEGGKTIVKTCVVAVAAFVAIWRRLQDLGQLASDVLQRPAVKARLAGPAGYLLRRLGEAASGGDPSDLLSYLLFDNEYAGELIALGERDARAVTSALEPFLAAA